MGALSQQIIAKLSRAAWEPLRGQFMQMARLLLAVSPDAHSTLMTSYVKFTTNSDANSPAYAAIWLKSSKQLVVGLGLPEDYEAEELGPAPLKMGYRGLNKYFVVEHANAVPKDFAVWAKTAYRRALSSEPWAIVTGFVDELAARETAKQGLAAQPQWRKG